jgi:GMP synthase PP-ATPase subunit
MFSDNSKVAVLESAVEKISEGNARIATILAKHDERIEQSIKSDELLIKMIDEIKETEEKNQEILHQRIDKIEEEIKAFSKFRWQIGGVLVVAALLIGAGSRIVPMFLTPQPQQVIIERQ